MFHAFRFLFWVLSWWGDTIDWPDTDVEWLERHRGIIYPSLAAFVFLALTVGVVRAWRTTELNAEAKTKFKRDILGILRANLAGLITDDIAKRIGLDRLKTVGLLEEMQKDGLLQSHTTTQRLTVWRCRGFDTV